MPLEQGAPPPRTCHNTKTHTIFKSSRFCGGYSVAVAYSEHFPSGQLTVTVCCEP